jgi:L-seryl-tRNA(Ser) seleniumtransferase
LSSHRLLGGGGREVLSKLPIHEDLGVRRLVNADSMKTSLGGTLMPEPVVAAMGEAASAFVDMFDLQRAVSARIAALTHNEAAHVCTGASAGLVLSALACMTGKDLRLIGRLLLHGPEGLPRRQLIVQCGQRNPYDPALRLAGAQLVQVGNILQTFPWELEAAISDQTAGVVFFAGRHLGYGSLEFDEVVEIAHRSNVPVIVDAAGQLPPRENLWQFTERGADLVVFSGGKGLRGPQASGVILGRRELIEACALHASPHQRLARALKVGKEEMIGLLVAIETYLGQDEAEERVRCERIVDLWVRKIKAIRGMSATRDFPGTDGLPLPRAVVALDPGFPLSGPDLSAQMLAGDPSVAVAVAGARAVYLNPQLLRPGEEEAVLEALAAAGRRGARPPLGKGIKR